MDTLVDKINFIENNSDMFNIYVYFPLGSIYESKGKNGMSHLMEHMMMKRSKHYDTNRMYNLITLLGGNANAGTTKDLVYFYIKTTARSFETAADLMKDVVYHPYFDKEDLEKEKKVVLEEYNQREDSFENYVDEVATQTVFAEDNPYAKTVRGAINDIKSVTVEDMKNYVKTVRDKYVLVVSCDAKLMSKCKRYIYSIFGKNNKVNFFDKNLNNQMKTQLTSRVFIKSANVKMSQYTTYISFASYPNYMVKENIIFSLVKFILTSAGFNSILFSKVREERGLVYYINSFNEDYRYVGVYKITFASSNRNTPYIISLILTTLLEFVKNGLTASKLKYFKESYLNKIEYMFSDPMFIDTWRGDNLFYHTDISQKKIIEYISKCTNDDIKAIAKNVFGSDNIGIVSYGNYKNPNSVAKDISEIGDTFLSQIK